MVRAAEKLAPRVFLIAIAGLAFVIAAFAAPDPRIGVFLLASGLVLMWVGSLVRALVGREKRSRAKLRSILSRFTENDAAPVFATDDDGVIRYRNRAAVDRFGPTGETLLAAMGDLFASPTATLGRLQDRALAHGSAREDVVSRRGHVRLSVHRINAEGYVWRMEDLAGALPGQSADTIHIPMMAVSKTGTILNMNQAMRDIVGSKVGTLDRIINDLPLRPGDIHEIVGATSKFRARIAQVQDDAGRRELYILPSESGPTGDWELLDALPVPLLKISPKGALLLANRPARHLLGISSVAGDPFASLVEGLGRSVSDWVREAAEGRTVLKPEIMRASRASKETYIQVTLNRVIEGDETALIAVLNDSTELKTLEAQFVQSQKMQAIGQLAGGVAHDFNNLLTAISGHCDLLLLRHDRSDPEYADLVQIHQNANRAASLVGQLLAFSRKQTLKAETVHLRDTLSDLAHLLNRLVGEKVSLKLEHDPDLRPILADKRQIEQVLMNLVVNARDAMQDGGEIVISTRAEHLSQPLERDRAKVPAGDYCVVSVKDQGKGIPSDKLQAIFEPFFTTKKTGEGTGLGLSTAYGIVKQTGGFIFVDSIVGQGTEFQVYLPAPEIVETATVEAPKSQLEETASFDSGTILLVEDEAPVRAVASRALQMRGYTVIEADCAEEALEILKDDSLEIDVFVTDVIMPGMDGPSWVAKALVGRPGVKVVFMSGYAEESFSSQQAEIPNSVFLPKPFSLADLTSTVQGREH